MNLNKEKDNKRQKKWIKQRIKYGYSDRDIWSFDSFLAKVIAGGIREVADYGGYPSEYEDNPNRWKDELNFIADQFEWYARHQFSFQEFKEKEDDFHKAWIMLEENFGGLWT